MSFLTKIFKRPKKISSSKKEVISIQLGEGIKERKPPKRSYALASQILIRPIFTEKATDLKIQNKYLFEVAKKANKTELKKAIQSLYRVVPKSINILKVPIKEIRLGKIRGKTKGWKKAIVTLGKGETIEY